MTISITKKNKLFNEKLCSVRKIFDNYNLISGLHSFMSVEDKKFEKNFTTLKSAFQRSTKGTYA